MITARPPRVKRPSRGKRPKAAAKTVIGWREWVGLPAFGVLHIKAKIDTGAKTSALHAFDLEPFVRGGEEWVRFAVHPMQGDDTLIVPCTAHVVDRRFVTNSGGRRERRYVIETELKFGDAQWPIELTLTNRDEMGFRMLVGRSAMQGRLIVDPARSYQTTPRARPARPKARSEVKE